MFSLKSRSVREMGSRGFSLVEVVIAVGVFALAIVAVIGLLAPLGRSVTDVKDGDDANRVATALQAGLQNEVVRLKNLNSANYWSTFAGYLNGSTTLYASRDGTILGPDDNSSPSVWDTDKNGSVSSEEDAQKFFEIKLTRNATLSPNSGSNLDANAGYLAFNVTLRWPGYTADGKKVSNTPDAVTQQSVMILPAAVTR